MSQSVDFQTSIHWSACLQHEQPHLPILYTTTALPTHTEHPRRQIPVDKFPDVIRSARLYSEAYPEILPLTRKLHREMHTQIASGKLKPHMIGPNVPTKGGRVVKTNMAEGKAQLVVRTVVHHPIEVEFSVDGFFRTEQSLEFSDIEGASSPDPSEGVPIELVSPGELNIVERDPNGDILDKCR